MFRLAGVYIALATIVMLVAIPLSLAQVEPPKKPPIATTIKAKVLPASPKPGDQLVVDASASAGNVHFDHDFHAGSFLIDGKKLYASVPAALKDTKVYSVRITYWKEETTEKIDVKVIGTDTPVDPPPPLDGTIASLTKAFNEFAATQTKFNASLDARLKALEGAKPPPVPVPVPVPVDAFQAAVQSAWEKDGKSVADIGALAAIYRNSAPVVNNPNYTKVAEVLAAMHAAASSPTIIADRLPNVRRVLADEFNKNIGGTTATVLDAPTRAIIQAEFLKAQRALEGVK